MTTNPLLEKFSTPYESVPFNKIEMDHYMPALKKSIEDARNEISQIANSEKEPGFRNTIEGLEYAGRKLDRIVSVFFNLNYAHTNDKMQTLARKISPMLTEFSNDIIMNDKLFKKVKHIYEMKEDLNLNIEETKLLINRYKSFIRSGADLDDEKKLKIREISKELSKLTLQFGENVLAATNNFELHVTNEKDVAGLPEGILEAASTMAKEKEKEGWIFNLQFPSYVPFMQYAEKRDLREKMFKAYSSRCFNDKFDNQKIIYRIVELRLEKVLLLGYETYSDYVLEERMAKSADRVIKFLNELLDASMPRAKEEFKELQEYAKLLGADFDLQRWDWAYYAEKLKTEKFDINDEITRPYFELERVKKGIFNLAGKLYGLHFKLSTNIPKYHEEIDVYEVFDSDNNFLSLLYTDFHPRSTKQGGAWMTSFVDQYKKEYKDYRPHISIVCNFTRPTKTKPSLLSFNELTTFLHEFGHALHGMLSKCTYSTLSGTNVYRDFVELPSQFMENFAYRKEWLDEVAAHYETGEKIPQELIQKIIDSSNFLSGYAFVRQISFSLNDMAWHSVKESIIVPVSKFEDQAMSSTELFSKVNGICMSTSFSHIFSGAYAAGYYGYKWAEVLDADAFEVFKENGIYDKPTADSFKENILEKGGSDHPMNLYLQFRGKEPSIDPLLKRSGLR